MHVLLISKSKQKNLFKVPSSGERVLVQAGYKSSRMWHNISAHLPNGTYSITVTAAGHHALVALGQISWSSSTCAQGNTAMNESERNQYYTETSFFCLDYLK